MVNEHIARAIADIACFLEFTGQSNLNEDASMAAMEQLSYELGQLPQNAKEELSCALIEIAPSYGDRAAFVDSLPNTLGIR